VSTVLYRSGTIPSTAKVRGSEIWYHRFVGQDDAVQIIRSAEPLNSEPPLGLLSRDLVTPSGLFFIRTHGTVPEIVATEFRLSIDGAVKSPVKLSMDDIRRNFEKTSVMATLQCAGNRRCEMAVVGAIPGEVPWGAQAIGNAVWGGARLRDVLDSVGVSSGGRHVAFLGADEIAKDGKQISFGASVQLDKARAPETLLAYEMNGLPLEPIHGFPLRGIVPGFIGARSVKWLTSITLQAEPTKNFYQVHSYKLFPSDVTAKNVDWDRGVALEKVELNSVIGHPDDGASLTPGPVRVCGYSIGKGGLPVEQVEVSVDGGRSWLAADLVGKSEPWRWNLFEVRVELDPGTYEVIARARDAGGNTQPADGRTSWNFKGYAWNAWHRIKIDVK
jgi:sulfite oxidase